MSPVPRYLVSFHAKQIPHHFVDVLVIGAGIAGLRAAMEIDPRLSLLVITKDAMEESNSNYAQGGIASVIDPGDNFANHVEDTLVAGANLCDREVVEMVVRKAPGHIRELIDWGTRFDTEQGELILGREGGHSHRRIVHALGDATGHEVMRAMIQRAREHQAQFWPNTFTVDLLTHEGRCRGALVWHARHGRTFIWAKQTILCTGGAGQVYRETTNPEVATGDGHAIAYRAGAEMRDMEFMQFHPTMLYIAGGSRSLITEAMRGEGAWLVDAAGRRFMPDFDERAELAPRDVVSQAIVAQMEKTRAPSVFLDLSHLDAAHVRKRFPGIARTCAEFGIDIATDPIPVRPGAHYMIGGVTVDRVGRTRLPGLWAAGEVTSSGLHGANRLASNSLLEGLVFGAGRGQCFGRRGERSGYVSSDSACEFGRRAAHRAARSGRHSQLAQKLDVARGRRPPQRPVARRSGHNYSPVVSLRTYSPARKSRRLGAAKHAHHRQPDGRRRASPRRIARCSPPHRFPRKRRRPLAAAFDVRSQLTGQPGPHTTA